MGGAIVNLIQRGLALAQNILQIVFQFTGAKGVALAAAIVGAVGAAWGGGGAVSVSQPATSSISQPAAATSSTQTLQPSTTDATASSSTSAGVPKITGDTDTLQ